MDEEETMVIAKMMAIIATTEVPVAATDRMKPRAGTRADVLAKRSTGMNLVLEGDHHHPHLQMLYISLTQGQTAVLRELRVITQAGPREESTNLAGLAIGPMTLQTSSTSIITTVKCREAFLAGHLVGGLTVADIAAEYCILLFHSFAAAHAKLRANRVPRFMPPCLASMHVYAHMTMQFMPFISVRATREPRLITTLYMKHSSTIHGELLCLCPCLCPCRDLLLLASQQQMQSHFY